MADPHETFRPPLIIHSLFTGWFKICKRRRRRRGTEEEEKGAAKHAGIPFTGCQSNSSTRARLQMSRAEVVCV